MKKTLAVVLAALMLFALAACGEKEPSPVGGDTKGSDTSVQGGQKGDKSLPSIEYLKAEDNYNGDGEITQVHEWDASGESEMWTIYYNGATFESVESYVAGLVNAGWTNHYADEDGNYMEDTSDEGTARAYYCTSDYAEIEIKVSDFSDSMKFEDKAEFSFNLSIQFSKT